MCTCAWGVQQRAQQSSSLPHWLCSTGDLCLTEWPNQGMDWRALLHCSPSTWLPSCLLSPLSHTSSLHSPSLQLCLRNHTHRRTSSDYGETLTPHANPGFSGAGAVLRPHPTRPDWVLAHIKRPGCRLLDEVEMRCTSDLFVSQVCYNTEKGWSGVVVGVRVRHGFSCWGSSDVL
jgi:hypothetical protein